MQTAYIAPKGYCQMLLDELHDAKQEVLAVRDPLVLVKGEAIQATWAQNTWFEPFFIPIHSVSDAARQLKTLQRNWHLTPTNHHRRAALIAEKLPYVSAKPLYFGEQPPTAALGSWTLWEPNTLLIAPHCSSVFGDGMVSFHENKTEPPSRAYLKLWELFTLFPETRPKEGEVCLDMGACPGGWTWVLATLGARVFAVDKAPLAETVQRLPNVTACRGSGFEIDPRHIGAVDWFFSDMICYPERLLALIQRWRTLGECRRFVCTVKLQGDNHAEILREIHAVPHSRLVHLSCNKHELTWLILP